jgi:hypothetical protein
MRRFGFAFLALALVAFSAPADDEIPIPIPGPVKYSGDFSFDKTGGYGVVHVGGDGRYVIRVATWGWGNSDWTYRVQLHTEDSKFKKYTIPLLTGQDVWQFGGWAYIGTLEWNEYWLTVPAGSQLETDIKNSPTKILFVHGTMIHCVWQPDGQMFYWLTAQHSTTQTIP